MHAAELAAVFGAIGAILGVALNIPQAWTSCARRGVAGLSPTARWLAVLQSATWCAYAVTEGTSSQLYSNLVCGALQLAVLAALLLLSPAARRSAAPLAVMSLVWLVVVAWAATGGSVDVGLLAAGCGTAAVVPQVVRLVRNRDEDTSGISPVTCVLAITCSVSWMLHGALLGAEAVWLPSLLSAAASAVTLLLVRRPVTPVADGAPAWLEPVGEHCHLGPRPFGVSMPRRTVRCRQPRLGACRPRGGRARHAPAAGGRGSAGPGPGAPQRLTARSSRLHRQDVPGRGRPPARRSPY